jgi:hypothetical protein
VKLPNLGADSIVRKRLLDLACDVTVDKAKPVEKKGEQQHRKNGDANDETGKNRVTPREVPPTLSYRSLWWFRALG